MISKINIGLIGYGNVGQGVVKFLQKKKSYIKKKFQCEFVLKAVCDKDIKKRPTKALGKILLTKDYRKVLAASDVDVVIELIGGLHPAQEIASGALKSGKHLVTANKELIGSHGKSLFQLAHKCDRNIYFESSVMAGVPVIKGISEGVAGNQFNSLYGIINGTCNYILTVMKKKNYSFSEAVKEAQERGFAETDPTKDINGMDSAHKLAILVSQAMGRFIKLSEIHTEGITHISHEDIENADNMGLAIKLLAITKKNSDGVEARVHPTLISKEHPLAAINGIYNAIFINADPLGDLLLSGEGAGQMAAASGVVSDLINLTSREGCEASKLLGNFFHEAASVKIRKIDSISSRFYFRFTATDKPGVLSKISGVLGRHGIGINSVTQKIHHRSPSVPVVMLTDYATEKNVRAALKQIEKLSIVKAKPVAIRMEDL